MLKGKSPNEYHQMLPWYVCSQEHLNVIQYSRRQSIINFETAGEILMEADKKLAEKKENLREYII